MALDADLQSVVDTLSQRQNDRLPRLNRLRKYYKGEFLPQQLGLAMPPEMRDLRLVVDWPKVVVNGCAQLIRVLGFRIPGAPAQADDPMDPSTLLWNVLRYNRYNANATRIYREALLYGEAYASVGAPDDPNDPGAVVTAESPLGMITDVDVRTGATRSALRLYRSDPSMIDPEMDSGVIYTPDETVRIFRRDGKWSTVDIDAHGFGDVCVSTYTNYDLITDVHGDSDLTGVTDACDAATRAVTNLQAAQELMALPSRFLAGVDADDLVNADGEAMTTWQAYIGRIMAVANDNARLIETSAAPLVNFSDVMKLYASLVSSISGVPLYQLYPDTGLQPQTAEAAQINAMRLIQRAESKQDVFESADSHTASLVLRFAGIKIPDGARPLPIWRDAAAPTFAAVADGAQKMQSAGLVSRQYVQERLNMTPEQIAEENDRLDQESSNKLLTQLAANAAQTQFAPPAGAPAPVPPVPGSPA